MQFTQKQGLLHIQDISLRLNGERARIYNRLLLKCLTSNEPIEVLPSETWSDDSWYIDQENREFIKNEGYVSIQEGEATGDIIGGNMSTFNLLQGTPYMPNLKEKILFIEEDSLTGTSTLKTFDRYLHSLMQQQGFEYIKGIVIGKMQKVQNVR